MHRACAATGQNAPRQNYASIRWTARCREPKTAKLSSRATAKAASSSWRFHNWMKRKRCHRSLSRDAEVQVDRAALVGQVDLRLVGLMAIRSKAGHRRAGQVVQEAGVASDRLPSRSHPSKSDWFGLGLIKVPSNSPETTVYISKRGNSERSSRFFLKGRTCLSRLDRGPARVSAWSFRLRRQSRFDDRKS